MSYYREHLTDSAHVIGNWDLMSFEDYFLSSSFFLSFFFFFFFCLLPVASSLGFCFSLALKRIQNNCVWVFSYVSLSFRIWACVHTLCLCLSVCLLSVSLCLSVCLSLSLSLSPKTSVCLSVSRPPPPPSEIGL